MTAKEMFENLGFNYNNGQEWIVCTNNITRQAICFRKTEYYIEYTHLVITIGVLKAINKQVEELGW